LEAELRILFALTVQNYYSCLDKPVMTPSRLVVKFGDPTSATCVACQQACFPLDDSIRNMEASLGTSNINGNTVTWTVNRMTVWDLTPKCYYTTIMNDQCCTDLPVTVYKPPESVSFSLNPSGPLTEGSEVTLQCDVQNVAPAENLTVTFYRGHTLLGQVKSSNTAKKPVNEIFSMSYNSTKEDNGVQFWCEAKLELGAEGPQPPLVVKSKETTATVYCKFRETHRLHRLDYQKVEVNETLFRLIIDRLINEPQYFFQRKFDCLGILNHLCSLFCLFLCRKLHPVHNRRRSNCCSCDIDRRSSHLHFLLQTEQDGKVPTKGRFPFGLNESHHDSSLLVKTKSLE
uniref:Ig-like domain-containing protein n=1 Tax=Xiphophorus maculatus TaxID=8083 RepID=A0A3B5R4G9_XIPMA